MERKIRRNIALYSAARFLSMAGGIILFTSNTWHIRAQTGSALRVIEAMSILPLFGAIVGSSLATVLLGGWSRKRTILITCSVGAAINFSIGCYCQFAPDVTFLISAGQFLTGILSGICEPAANTYLSDLGGKSTRGTGFNQIAEALAFAVPAGYIWYCLGSGDETERFMVTHSYFVNGAASLIACALYFFTAPVTDRPVADAVSELSGHFRHPLHYVSERLEIWRSAMASGGKTLILALALVSAQHIFFTSFYLFPGYVLDVLQSGERTHAALRFIGPFLTIPVLCLVMTPAFARFQPRTSIQTLFLLMLVQGIFQALWPLVPNTKIACLITSLNWIPFVFAELTTFRLFQTMEGDRYRGEFFPLRFLVIRISPGLRWLIVWQLSSPSLGEWLSLSDARRIAILGISGVAAMALAWLWRRVLTA